MLEVKTQHLVLKALSRLAIRTEIMYGVRILCDNDMSDKQEKKMRHGSSNRRQRNRGGSRRGGNQQRSQVFDSNGPDVRIRGTAHQVTEKYAALDKDTASSGDSILAESYLQHAEHYQRIISSWDDDQNTRTDRTPAKSKKEDGAEGELALPSSILGEGSQAKPQETAVEAAT